MTPSEEFIYNLCRRSFLSLWSIPNPQGITPNQELCDVLVACDPDVIIFSVKEISYKPSEDVTTGLQRWHTKAIEASARQIYGAERALGHLTEVKRKDGSDALHLPPRGSRRIHRVAVALGSKDEVPMHYGDFGKGFVHVLDGTSAGVLLRELDTITDFTSYFVAKENFLSPGQFKVIMSAEEDLLALYLHGERSFPTKYNGLLLENDLWKGISSRKEFQLRLEADRASYFWDNLIEHLVAKADPGLTQHLPGPLGPDGDTDVVVRIMARESRFARRVLAKSFMEFHLAGKIRSRVMQSLSGVTYVFLACPHDYDRAARTSELLGRCFIARGLNRSSSTVVGLATEIYEKGKGFSLDACLYEKQDWTEEDKQRAQEIQQATGAFQAPHISQAHEDEYPKKK